jgi:putative hydrolase of the HAD superfamily
MAYRAVIFDLGGVVFPSPFEAFDSYGRAAGLPDGFVREVVRESSETGAWAALERGELTMSEFHAALEAEAEARGHRLSATALMQTVGSGFGPRPAMVAAIRAIRAAGLRTAALTNNWLHPDGGTMTEGLARDELFDVVVESSVEGLRKPDPRIYELVLERLEVEARGCAYLDDLGINLKPARAMGMTTIKVTDADAALAELEAALGVPLSPAG